MIQQFYTSSSSELTIPTLDYKFTGEIHWVSTGGTREGVKLREWIYFVYCSYVQALFFQIK